MSTEILVNASMHEARAAVVENGVLQEVFLERASRRGLISNIYKGRVSRVLPKSAWSAPHFCMHRTSSIRATPTPASSRRAPRTSAPWWRREMKYWSRW
jgi:ribonuclease G